MSQQTPFGPSTPTLSILAAISLASLTALFACGPAQPGEQAEQAGDDGATQGSSSGSVAGTTATAEAGGTTSGGYSSGEGSTGNLAGAGGTSGGASAVPDPTTGGAGGNVSSGGVGGAAMGGAAMGGAAMGGAAMGGAGGGSSAQGSIPQNIRLWCLSDRNIARPDFPQFLAHYVENDAGTQVFKVAKGDFDLRNDGVTQECRVEAFDIDKWAPGKVWHSFEATFTITTTSPDELCFIQYKNNVTENPQLMCHFKGGQLTCSPRGQGPKHLGNTGKNYNATPFKLKLRSNGNLQEVYFNDVKVDLGNGSVPAETGPNVKDYFRWGIYMNYPASASYRVSVSGISHD